AGFAAIASAILAVALQYAGGRVSKRSADAMFVAIATFITIASVGFVWAFRANGADRTIGVPVLESIVILGIALGVGALVHRLAHGYASNVLASAWRVATFGVVGTMIVGAVFPAQVLIE